MQVLCTDVLLWLSAVTEDTVHMEMELEKQFDEPGVGPQEDEDRNATLCRCSQQMACVAMRKGYEILYPFNMEFSLLAGCMLYVMWKNVGRHVHGAHPHTQNLTLRIMRHGGVLTGPILGVLVLISGAVVFLLYQVWVVQPDLRLKAFLMFYGFHICVMPIMSLCSLTGMLVYRHKERKELKNRMGRSEGPEGGTNNPTRSLDVLLLLGAGLGQLTLSYFSLVAALGSGAGGILGHLDLSFSVLSLMELVLQNVFIIQGLQENPHLHSNPDSDQRQSESEAALKTVRVQDEEKTKSLSLTQSGDQSRSKRVIQEICMFLILANIMLWVIPAFGAHPQFESGVGKRFFGFSVWFVLVNLGQPLTVFYRMHSVGVLMELLVSA